MEAKDRSEVADLICASTNHWYQVRGRPASFPAGPGATDVFFDVYQALDPGCGVVAENIQTGRLTGSCFYHPRPLHCSLGIMNVHPNYFRRGVARALLAYVIDYADRKGSPAVRLTSSAMNLDSFSLYNRAGFVPRCVYQDMIIDVPPSGFTEAVDGSHRVRPATLDDVEQIARLEMEVSGIRRDVDYRFAIANRGQMWEILACEGEAGAIDGFLISVKHPAMCALGPGVMRTEQQAAALVAKALDRHAGGSVLFLVPVLCRDLVRRMYAWGAKNCELHFCQVRGEFQPFAGVNMPAFLPETG
jgi:ribosomal protein S18 acetylase RimI-like enzyme